MSTIEVSGDGPISYSVVTNIDNNIGAAVYLVCNGSHGANFNLEIMRVMEKYMKVPVRFERREGDGFVDQIIAGTVPGLRDVSDRPTAIYLVLRVPRGVVGFDAERILRGFYGGNDKDLGDVVVCFAGDIGAHLDTYTLQKGFAELLGLLNGGRITGAWGNAISAERAFEALPVVEKKAVARKRVPVYRSRTVLVSVTDIQGMLREERKWAMREARVVAGCFVVMFVAGTVFGVLLLDALVFFVRGW